MALSLNFEHFLAGTYAIFCPKLEKLKWFSTQNYSFRRCSIWFPTLRNHFQKILSDPPPHFSFMDRARTSYKQRRDFGLYNLFFPESHSLWNARKTHFYRCTSLIQTLIDPEFSNSIRLRFDPTSDRSTSIRLRYRRSNKRSIDLRSNSISINVCK